MRWQWGRTLFWTTIGLVAGSFVLALVGEEISSTRVREQILNWHEWLGLLAANAYRHTDRPVVRQASGQFALARLASLAPWRRWGFPLCPAGAAAALRLASGKSRGEACLVLRLDASPPCLTERYTCSLWLCLPRSWRCSDSADLGSEPAAQPHRLCIQLGCVGSQAAPYGARGEETYIPRRRVNRLLAEREAAAVTPVSAGPSFLVRRRVREELTAPSPAVPCRALTSAWWLHHAPCQLPVAAPGTSGS